MSEPTRFPKCAAAVAAYLAEREINPSQLAREIEVENSVVQRWCRGETRPTGVNLLKLKGKTGLTDEALYADSLPGFAGEPEEDNGGSSAQGAA